jgi:hypothetical protein
MALHQRGESSSVLAVDETLEQLPVILPVLL